MKIYNKFFVNDILQNNTIICNAFKINNLYWFISNFEGILLRYMN